MKATTLASIAIMIMMIMKYNCFGGMLQLQPNRLLSLHANKNRLKSYKKNNLISYIVWQLLCHSSTPLVQCI